MWRRNKAPRFRLDPKDSARLEHILRITPEQELNTPRKRRKLPIAVIILVLSLCAVIWLLNARPALIEQVGWRVIPPVEETGMKLLAELENLRTALGAGIDEILNRLSGLAGSSTDVSRSMP